MTQALLLREDIGAVTRLSLNAPASLKALSDAMLVALAEAFVLLAEGRIICVVILRGAGRVFCAGHDLKDMQAARTHPDKGGAYFADLFARAGAVMQMIAAQPYAGAVMVENILWRDTDEGIAAFLEKRKPDWQD